MSNTSLVVSNVRALLVLLACVTPTGIRAQGSIIDKGTSGVRESARIGEDTTTREVGVFDAGAGREYSLLFSPSTVAAEGVLVYGATAGFINAGALSTIPFQLKVGYRRLDLEEGDDADRVNVNGLLPLNPLLRLKSDRTAVSAIMDYTRTFDTSSKYAFTLAGEQTLHGPFSVGLNGTYALATPDDGDEVDDVVVSTGVVIAPSTRADLSLDYEFENALAGEDDYSATLRVRLPFRRTTRIVTGVGKHWTAWVTLVFVR